MSCQSQALLEIELKFKIQSLQLQVSVGDDVYERRLLETSGIPKNLVQDLILTPPV